MMHRYFSRRLTSLSQTHRQPLLFDTKYPLTNKNSLPILSLIESNTLSNKYQGQCTATGESGGRKMKVGAAKKDKDRENISPEELQRMWVSVDLSRFWTKVVQNVSKEADAYERARAKSREGAAHQVLL